MVSEGGSKHKETRQRWQGFEKILTNWSNQGKKKNAVYLGEMSGAMLGLNCCTKRGAIHQAILMHKRN